MIAMTPVLERVSIDCPFWPVNRTEFFLPVPRRPTPEQVGTVVWTLVAHYVTADDRSITVATPAEAITTYLTRDEDDFTAGSLRVTADDVTIDPGCCADLSEWRDWLNVIDGGNVDHGHDPNPMVEHLGPVVRLWQDAEKPRADDRYIDISRDDLLGLLDSVRLDLAGFLDALRPWAEQTVGELSGFLVEDVDRRLRISATLGFTASRRGGTGGGGRLC